MRALLLLVAMVASAANAAELKAGVFDPPRMAPAFSLPATNGKTVSPGQFRGKVVLLGFGYTHCTAVCPVTLANFKQVSRKLGAQASELQVIYVTVDPKRDTVEALRKYLAAFDPAFIGATGSAAQLAAVRKDYGVTAMDAPGMDGSMTHSSFVYLIDRRGRLRALMPFGHSADDYVHDIRILLAAP